MNRYSLFLDISGSTGRETKNHSFYTVGGVIIATARVEKARAAISRVGRKWEDMHNTSATRMIEAILNFSMIISARQTRKSQPSWANFWNDGDRFHNFMASVERSRVGFVKSSTLVRYNAFCEGSAQSLGHCLRRHGLPEVIAPNGFYPLELNVTCDTDIQGQENIDTFWHMWTEYQSRSQMKPRLGIELKLRNLDLKTEQDEPLLLAPDFVAGCFQWHLGKPEVPLPENLDESSAETAIKEFKTSSNLILSQTDFHLTYEAIFGDLLNQTKP